MDCEYCSGVAVQWLSERYEAQDGLGAIERIEAVCTDCAAQSCPKGLEGVYANYEYQLEQIPEEFRISETGWAFREEGPHLAERPSWFSPGGI